MRAADEYGEAVHYVANSAPLAAKRLAQRIMKRIRSLRQFPMADGYLPEDASKTTGSSSRAITSSFTAAKRTS